MNFLQELVHVQRGSCFTYTLATALGVKESVILGKLKGLPECQTRAFYSSSLVADVMEELGLEYTLTDCFPYDYDYFEQVITESLFSGYKVMICYNAQKGATLLGKRPTPESGHYCEIISIVGDRIRGRQSNVDGEKAGVLKDTSLMDLWEASRAIRGLKVDYGKIRKCHISVGKHEVETVNRCGLTTCKFTGNNRCRFYSDMGGVVIAFKEGVSIGKE